MTDTPSTGGRIVVYGTTCCPDCKLARSVLDRQGSVYSWVDIDRDPAAVDVVLRLNGGFRTVPTVIFPDGRILVEPTRRELESALGETAPAA